MSRRNANFLSNLTIFVALSLGVSLAQVSDARGIPEPFEPITVDLLENSGWDVHVWGRTYRFGSSPLPDSILSQGKELLLAPPWFEVATQGGSPSPLHFHDLTLTSSSSESVEFDAIAIAGDIEFKINTRVEYDGMIRVRIRSASDRDRQITHFSYRFELNTPLLEWFNHHVPYDYQALNVDKDALLRSAGQIQPGESRYDYTPTFFLGGRELGFEWWSETNLEWSRNRGYQPISLSRTPVSTRFEVTPINTPKTLGPGHQFTHEFAVFATPMRPPPDNWRARRFSSSHATNLFDKRPDLQFYWIVFPDHFSSKYHGLPGARQDAKQLALREMLKKLNVSYIPYAKLTASPSGHPRPMLKADDWAANRQRFTVPPANERKALLAGTDWKPGQPYGYAVCAERMEYLEWIRDESLATLVEEELGGLYFDFGAISRMCERASNAPRTGFLEPNRLRPEFWHYLNIREFYKTLYEGMKKMRPESILTIHTHGQPRSLSAWADFTFIGEALNVKFRNGHRFPEIAKNPSLYTPDYLTLPSGFMDAITFPRIGGITSWLPELKYAQDPKNPRRLLRFQRAFFAWLLVNDVHVWMGMGDFPAMVEVYRAIDQFGSLDDAELSPWWNNATSIVRDPALQVTTYTSGDTVLLIVSNLGKLPVRSKIQFSPEASRANAVKRVRDLEKMGPARWTPLHERSFQVTVPGEDFRVFMATP